MADTVLFCAVLSFFFFLLFALKFMLLRGNQYSKKHPPTPFALPIIGHLHLLKPPLHRTLHNLSHKFGPIIFLRFGCRPVLLVSSASIAAECFTKHDIVFANRPSYRYGKYIYYNGTTLGTANYGGHWRNLRKLSKIEILSSTRVYSLLHIRKDEVKVLLQRLHRLSGGSKFAEVQMRRMLIDLTSNIILRIVAGKRYPVEDESGVQEAKPFREIMQELSESVKTSNAGDLIPILQWLDFGGGVPKKLQKLRKKMDCFFQQLIEENRANRDRGSFINRLLNLQEEDPQYYTDDIVKGLIQIFLQAGTRTSAISLEWALANLLNNPQVLKKAKIEIDTQVGQSELLDEKDLPKLPYLHSIICENLRLYPVSPLVPHMSSEDCTVGGYHVARGTMLFANLWAIHRDPALWEDPTSFKPERFENGGEASKVMAFGLGRRACPGEVLANRVLGLTLGSLIQCFEWEKIKEGDIDMAEQMNPIVSMIEPLEVFCKSRPNIHKLLS